jgi:tetratricopeptide (TPR) repeat protein
VRRLERGDAKGAEETFRDALEEAALVDDLQGQAEAWNNLGALAMARGRPDEALSCHRTALHFHRARGTPDLGEIRSRANAGAALLALGRVAEAEIDLAAALAVEGAALDALGDASAARARFEEALDIDRKREAPFAVASDLRALSRLAERRGDLAAASSYLARSARIARWMGDYDRALRELRRALSLAREADSRDIELIESELAELLRTTGAPGSEGAPPVAAPIK